jgi:hypothetical protein
MADQDRNDLAGILGDGMRSNFLANAVVRSGRVARVA